MIRLLIVAAASMLLAACATSPRGKLANLDDALTSAISLSAMLIEQGVIKDADKPKLEACFRVAEAGIAEARLQLLAGVDSKPAYKLALKYFGIAQTFLETNKGNLNACAG